MPKGTVSVRLDEATLERLGAIAKATGRSRGALMTYAIEALRGDRGLAGGSRP